MPSLEYLSAHRLLKEQSSQRLTAPVGRDEIRAPMAEIFSALAVAPGITGVRTQIVSGYICFFKKEAVHLKILNYLCV